jgi:predicted TIM-barrel fold metal-dependent hydrolase
MPPPIPNLDTAYNLLISTAAPTRDARRNVVTPTPPNSIIACLESHLCPILPVGTFSSTGPSHAALHLISTPVLSKLKDLGPARVEDMRSLGQTRQIVSHVPILTNPAACVKLNDTTYTSIQQNGDKFSALASLPCAAGEGKAAARELQRCITKMRFVGGVFVLGRHNSDALLDTSFNELWNMAEKFRMPIALREAWPCGAEVR